MTREDHAKLPHVAYRHLDFMDRRNAIRRIGYGKVRQQEAADIRAKRAAANRAMLERQKKRELSGFYEGQTTVANALAHRRAGRLHRRVLVDDTAKARAGNLVRLA